jgi:hypothetical protein
MLLPLTASLAAADAGPTLRHGRWSVHYEVVDVSTDLVPRPEMFVGHRWGGTTCLAKNAASASAVLDTDSYRCAAISFLAGGGRVLATRICNGGHMIPGRGTETFVGSVQDDRITGISDVTLVSDPDAAITHIRSVVIAQRTGDCR